MLIRLQQAV